MAKRKYREKTRKNNNLREPARKFTQVDNGVLETMLFDKEKRITLRVYLACARYANRGRTTKLNGIEIDSGEVMLESVISKLADLSEEEIMSSLAILRDVGHIKLKEEKQGALVQVCCISGDSKDKPFTKVDDDALDTLLATKGHIDMLRLYLYCRVRANFGKPYSKLSGNGVIRVNAGQLIYGGKAASERLGIPHSTLDRKLKALQQLGFISLASTNRYTLVTVRPIERVDTEWETDGRQMGNSRETNGDIRRDIYREKKTQTPLQEVFTEKADTTGLDTLGEADIW